jgi:hypothetical protein
MPLPTNNSSNILLRWLPPKFRHADNTDPSRLSKDVISVFGCRGSTFKRARKAFLSTDREFSTMARSNEASRTQSFG